MTSGQAAASVTHHDNSGETGTLLPLVVEEPDAIAWTVFTGRRAADHVARTINGRAPDVTDA